MAISPDALRDDPAVARVTHDLHDAHDAGGVLESMPTAFFSLDRDWCFTYVNAEAERLLARSRDELLGRELWSHFPAALDSEFETSYRRAMAGPDLVAFDAYYPHPLDAWYEVRAWPSPDGLSVYFLDITARRVATQQATRAVERAQLTTAVTAQLTETLDAEVAVARLAHLLVPALGDWCVVTLLDDDGRHRRLHDVGWWHHDPVGRPLVQRYAEVRLSALRDDSFLAQAVGTAEVITIPRSATAQIQGVLDPGEAWDLLGRLGPETATVLPMRGRGRTVGAISLFNGPDRPALADEDLLTLREIAGRAGLALDNARLYKGQRELAERLQRSMLTEPPAPDHLQIAVRYVPANEAAKVGGDWYDAFMQPDGATVLVIGDVVGHDFDATAAMGQLRALLRGIAVATGSGPAVLIEQVDRALRTLELETIATAVVARVEQTPEEREHGTTHLRWANAGHPAPMVITADGSVLVLTRERPDPLLGVLPDFERAEHDLVIDRGSTVLLYTDGLVERRDRPLREGMDLLREALLDLGHLELEELCDALLARMLPTEPDDDVALVAIRLHPQDRPRPTEAGPNSTPPDVPDPSDEAHGG